MRDLEGEQQLPPTPKDRPPVDLYKPKGAAADCWQYFNLRSTVPGFAFCTKCDHKFNTAKGTAGVVAWKKGDGTGSLSGHLNAKHEMAKPKKQDTGGSVPRADIRSFAPFDQATQLKMHKSYVKNMIIVDLMPFSSIEKKGTRAFLKDLQPRYTPCNKNKVAELFEEQAGAIEASVLDSLTSDVRDGMLLSGATDIWTSKGNDSFVGIIVFYINNKWEIVALTLSVSEFNDSHSGQNQLDKIRSARYFIHHICTNPTLQ